MQLDRFRALKEVRVARLSGISVKRFEDKSSDWRVFARGRRLEAGSTVKELSAMLRCRKNLHFVEGMVPRESRFDELPRGVLDLRLEFELPDERRSCGVLLRPNDWDELFFALDGRLGDLLFCLRCIAALVSGDSSGIVVWCPAFSSEARLRRDSGEPIGYCNFTNSACLIPGLEEAGHGAIGELGILADRRRRLSMSSSTILTRRSAGSLTPARFTVRLRRLSANLSQPYSCRKSTSHISSAVMFLKAKSGTAVSKGNSS